MSYKLIIKKVKLYNINGRKHRGAQIIKSILHPSSLITSVNLMTQMVNWPWISWFSKLNLKSPTRSKNQGIRNFLNTTHKQDLIKLKRLIYTCPTPSQARISTKRTSKSHLQPLNHSIVTPKRGTLREVRWTWAGIKMVRWNSLTQF